MNSDNQLSLEDLLNEAAGGSPAPEDPAPEDPAPQDPALEDPAPEDPAPQDPAPGDPNPAPKPKPENKPNPMKEVREKLNSEQKLRVKMGNAIKRYTEGDYKFKIRDYKTEDGDVDYDRLIEAMDEADNATKANNNNITPEVQKELDRIEREKIEIQKERLKIAMDKSLADMQVEFNLKSADINKFFADALAQQRNPYQWIAQGGDIKDLYYILYRDKMIQDRVNSAVAEERAKWENAKPSPTPNPVGKQTPPSNKEGLSLTELLKQVK